MATRRQKNGSYQKKQERRNRWREILGGILGIGIQVFFLLNYFTHIPINTPIDPEDTITVTAHVTDTWFGENSNIGRRGNGYHYHFLYIYTDFGKFRMTGPRVREKLTEPGAYNMLALNDVIQPGDTLTITYRKYYPYLVPGKYVVGLREGDQIYRSLDAHNESIEGKLVSMSIGTAVGVLLTLPVTLFLLDVPQKIWKKADKKRRLKKKAAKQQETAPD